MAKNRVMRISMGLLLILSITILNRSFAQEESSEKAYHFKGNISVTNNGVSFIPTFSRGKPATIADISIGGKRFSFDPQFTGKTTTQLISERILRESKVLL